MSRRLPDPAEEPTVSVERWSDVIGIGKNTIYDAIHRGEIPSIRVGRRIVIPTAKALVAAGLADAA